MWIMLAVATWMSTPADVRAPLELAELLKRAHSISLEGVGDDGLHLAIATGASRAELIVVTDAGGRPRSVVHAALAPSSSSGANVSWIADELRESGVSIISQLRVTDRGALVLVTDCDRPGDACNGYVALPEQQHAASNAAVEARWAASWDRGDE